MVRLLLLFICIFFSLIAEEEPWLKLDSLVDPSKPLYPGEKFKISYTIYYRGGIDLTIEQLPLLESEGFQKIGSKEINESSQGNISIQTIVQKFKATSPGTYSYPPSIVEGRSYVENEPGKKTYAENKLSSQTPSVTIEVLPFPEMDKPLSFDGAIGNFVAKAALITPSEIAVGDEIQVSLEIMGSGEMDTVNPPELSCQPGFSGFFQLSNLPPQEKSTGISKQYIYSMRSNSNLVEAIPAIEFSSFETKSKKYVISKTEPIPISIKRIQEAKEGPVSKPVAAVKVKKENPWRREWKNVPEFKMENMPKISDKTPSSSTWRFLYLIPFLIGFLAIQKLMKKS